MKVLLATLNSKFTHSNLALRYLRAYCWEDFPNITVKEYNINQELRAITGDLVRNRPDVLGFSCYIWNITQTLEIVQDLKKVCPNLVIVLGGPEVSYEYEHLMLDTPEIDYLIAGEGEDPLRSLLSSLNKGQEDHDKNLPNIPGLVYRDKGQLRHNSPTQTELDTVPYIYDGSLHEFKNKIVYYEASRGCPFRCAYCLSSRTGKVRFFPLERTFTEIERLSRAGVEQVRFVDRTFNCNPERALALIKMMAELPTATRFQLEIAGELLTDQLLNLLRTAPKGRFQFEIGVQTTFRPALERINRSSNLSRLENAVRRLREETDVRIVLDLIAGLPGESLERFGESFDFVYNLQPDKIHLGFLKLLKGSSLREQAAEFGCSFRHKAPYEVLRTDSISFEQLDLLHVVEDLVEKFSNSGRFSHSLAYLLKRNGQTPFSFFRELASKWVAQGLNWRSQSVESLYNTLHALVGAKDPVLLEVLRLDYRIHELTRATPQWLGGRGDKSLEYAAIHSGKVRQFLPEFGELSPREISKRIFVEQFSFRVYPEVAVPALKEDNLLLFHPSSGRVFCI